MNLMRNVIIIGDLGRAFHNFNVYFKNNHNYKVIAFLSNQASRVLNQNYPIQLTGKQYPLGIPIFVEDELSSVIKKYDVDECVFAKSNYSQKQMINLATKIQAAGADFKILGTNTTMLKHLKPVIAVCGLGLAKTQVSCKVVEQLKLKGLNSVVVKHPVPEGDIKEKIAQSFSKLSDLEYSPYTSVEREEIKQQIANGTTVYMGVDYHDVLNKIDKDSAGCDVIVWENANEDMPFIKPDLLITIINPDKINGDYFNQPIDLNISLSDVVIIDKVSIAEPSIISKLRKKVLELNNKAVIIEAASPVEADDFELIWDKRVALVEFANETKTHFSTSIAADKYGASDIVMHDDSKIYPITNFETSEVNKLQNYLNNTDCDLVLVDTPIDISKTLRINKPIVKVKMQLQELGTPNIASTIHNFVKKI